MVNTCSSNYLLGIRTNHIAWTFLDLLRFKISFAQGQARRGGAQNQANVRGEFEYPFPKLDSKMDSRPYNDSTMTDLMGMNVTLESPRNKRVRRIKIKRNTSLVLVDISRIVSLSRISPNYLASCIMEHGPLFCDESYYLNCWSWMTRTITKFTFE